MTRAPRPRRGPRELRLGRLRADLRTVVLTVVLVAIALGLALVGLCFGASWSTPGEVFAVLFGPEHSVVIVEWRLARVTAALVFGAALGVAGAIFQNLTRNPMGSPDVIGLDTGSYTGALFAITVLAGTSGQRALASVVGGLAVAAAIYLLSSKGGFSGLRLVVIGIGVNAMMTAVNSWIVLRAELEVAIAAVGWSAGSLNGVGWHHLWLPFTVLAVLLALLVARAHAMHQTSFGDAIAVTTGVSLKRLRLLMVLIGVGCTATVTAVAGPIAFIALAAPQIGRRLAGAPGVPLLPAALTGAVLLLGADLIAQALLAPVALPVGVVSTAIGGCYLIRLLTREVRRA
ncbi:iron chelate uptake ABC transporter family permease subunit [Streptomyces calidiresistens]|uniref:Iron chelate uptake ABC transporter family permease subunit n=1 Tax=Streptomyces calidiresistens TaxID=1485586 RepID=A0A7W3XVC9_9ACTN|nr:iron chelate uptake ABC transporter family permease subunit [Streptomyces calidiresistens]